MRSARQVLRGAIPERTARVLPRGPAGRHCGMAGPDRDKIMNRPWYDSPGAKFILCKILFRDI